MTTSRLSSADRENLLRVILDAAYRDGADDSLKAELLADFCWLFEIDPATRGQILDQGSKARFRESSSRGTRGFYPGRVYRELLSAALKLGAIGPEIEKLLREAGRLLGLPDTAFEMTIESAGKAPGAMGELPMAPAPVAVEERINRVKSDKLVTRGTALSGTKDFEEAIAVFREALELDPKNSEAWRGLGFVYRELGDHQKHVEILEQGLRIIRVSAILIDLGNALRKLNRDDEALVRYQEASELDPRELVGLTNTAMLLTDRAQYAEAERYARLALAADPAFPNAFARLGEIAERLGKIDDAVKYFEKADQLKPNYWHLDLRRVRQELRKQHMWAELPKPSQMVQYLDRFVCSQQEAKRALAGAIYSHYLSLGWQDENILHGDLGRYNALLFGPSGCGKTYMIELLTKRLGVPLALISATSLVQTGYVGKKIESIVGDLLAAANYEVARAERGIIFIDEIDKIRRQGAELDVSGEGVQNGLLTILEGRPVSLVVEGKGAYVVNTSRILFIAAGAFDGIADICRTRKTRGGSLGFGATSAKSIGDAEAYRSIRVEDLEQYGMIPQLVGRFSVLSHLEVLTRDDLRAILTTMEGSILAKQQTLFEIHGIELEITPDAIEAILDLTSSSRTGARGLRAALSRALEPVIWKIDQLEEQGVTKVTIDAGTVSGDAEPRIVTGEAGASAPRAAHLRKVAFGSQSRDPGAR